MEKEKKKWETPKLICLYRGRPEEAVLQGCKGGIAAGGPGEVAGQRCVNKTSGYCSEIVDT